jgi:hypothetical protein
MGRSDRAEAGQFGQGEGAVRDAAVRARGRFPPGGRGGAAGEARLPRDPREGGAASRGLGGPSVEPSAVRPFGGQALGGQAVVRPPGRAGGGSAAAEVAVGAALVVVWALLWSFLLLGVAAPARRLHASVAGHPGLDGGAALLEREVVAAP